MAEGLKVTKNHKNSQLHKFAFQVIYNLLKKLCLHDIRIYKFFLYKLVH